MKQITSIGVINSTHKHHIDFTVTYLTHKAVVEAGMAYQLWKEGDLDFALEYSQEADKFHTEILFLRQAHKHHTESVLDFEVL